MNTVYCLNCGMKIDNNLVFKDKGGDFFHYRLIQAGKPEVTKCGPVDFFDDDNLERDDDESEMEVT